MPAPKILSEGQWNIMLDYMEANPIFAKGNIANMSRHEAKEENNMRWKRLANRLNSVGSGCIKNYIKWRENNLVASRNMQYERIQTHHRLRGVACQASRDPDTTHSIPLSDMPAKPIITDRQWKLLLQYMEAHPEFANAVNQTSPAIRDESHNRWDELTSILNNEGTSCKRSLKGWRDYWNQAKYKARQRACTIRRQLKALKKGDPIKLLSLTKKDRRVLKILGIPMPEFGLVNSSSEARLNGAPTDTPPPDSPQPETSAEPKIEVRSESDGSEADAASKRSPSPPVRRRPPTKLVWNRVINQKGAYESSAISTRVYSAPYGSTARKRFRPAPPPAAEWVRNLEERRITVEERSSRALQGIQANTEFCANALQGIQKAQERMNRTLQGIQCALEASARALEGRLS